MRQIEKEQLLIKRTQMIRTFVFSFKSLSIPIQMVVALILCVCVCVCVCVRACVRACVCARTLLIY